MEKTHQLACVYVRSSANDVLIRGITDRIFNAGRKVWPPKPVVPESVPKRAHVLPDHHLLPIHQALDHLRVCNIITLNIIKLVEYSVIWKQK
jgi:hypothetical protein